MFDDILGKKKEDREVTKDSIIKSLEYNLEKKEEMIQNLLKQLVETERQLEEVLSYQDHQGLCYG